MVEYGPGLSWLAERAGCTPEELLADPRRLLAALADAERAMTGLDVRLHAADDDVRAEAEREADRLRRLFVSAPDPAERFRGRVLDALRDATERVRQAPPAPGDGAGPHDAEAPDEGEGPGQGDPGQGDRRRF